MTPLSLQTGGRLIARYKRALGVRYVRRVPSSAFRRMADRGAVALHPTILQLGFTRSGVVYSPEFRRVAYALPHEVTHVAWPMSLDEVGDAEGEWACGMIPFELAWLEVLCTRPSELQWLTEWREFSDDGAPQDNDYAGRQRCLEAAERITHDFGLPDPWEHLKLRKG